MNISRWEQKKNAPEGVHLPNKNEAKTLRKIRAQTGLTIEEIKSFKKYRKELSDSQVIGTKEVDEKEKCKKVLMKRITKELKLAKEHPLVIERFKTDWIKYYGKRNWN